MSTKVSVFKVPSTNQLIWFGVIALVVCVGVVWASNNVDFVEDQIGG